MSVMVPVEIFCEHGIKPSLVLEKVVPSGLNILGGKIQEQDEEVLVLGKIELAFNTIASGGHYLLRKTVGNYRR